MVARTRVPLLMAVLAGLAVIAPNASARAHRCVVPKVAGLTVSRAEKRLHAAGCLTRVRHPRLTAGENVAGLKVWFEIPKAGAHTNGRVELVVAPRTTKPKLTYRTAVDPTFTQDPANPLAVTYAYSASAVALQAGVTVDLTSTGQLPAGVLNFYSATVPGGPESLFCSINVGGTVTDGSCSITYTQTGTYSVTTEYVPNSATAVTETDQETISPFATSTTLTATPTDCGTLVPPGVSYPPDPSVGLQQQCYTIVLSSTAPQSLAMTVAATQNFGVSMNGPSNGLGALAPGSTCTLDVYRYSGTSGKAGGYSPDCGTLNWSGGGGIQYTTAWDLSASFPGSPGWVGSGADVPLAP